jgi:hypothetical protein
MAKQNRIQNINKADELVEFARKVFNNKRVELLKKAAQLYKKANLSLLAEKIEKEADDWQIWFN